MEGENIFNKESEVFEDQLHTMDIYKKETRRYTLIFERKFKTNEIRKTTEAQQSNRGRKAQFLEERLENCLHRKLLENILLKLWIVYYKNT